MLAPASADDDDDAAAAGYDTMPPLMTPAVYAALRSGRHEAMHQQMQQHNVQKEEKTPRALRSPAAPSGTRFIVLL